MSPEYESRLRSLKAALGLESVTDYKIYREDWTQCGVLLPLNSYEKQVGLFEVGVPGLPKYQYEYQYANPEGAQYSTSARIFKDLPGLLSYLETRR